MRLFMQILLVLFILAAVYAIVVGLGLTRVFKRHKSTTKTVMINDFEYPRDDFDWTTGGYVKIEPSTENQTHGKKCAKATFLLQKQFFPEPTPGVPSSSSGPTTWRPEMILDVNSVTRLPVYEWQEYSALKMDVFNDQAQPVTYHLQVADSRAFVYETSGPLTPKKVTNISMPTDDLVKSRLDLVNIRSLKFWVDMTGATEPVVVYLDNLRLEGDATVPAPKKEAPKSKP